MKHNKGNIKKIISIMKILREQIAEEVATAIVGKDIVFDVQEKVKKLTIWDIIKIIKMVIRLIKNLRG